MNKGKRLALRLFLEGIEVEVTEASANAARGQFATAQISIPSADEVHGILPRTLVHLFYWAGVGDANFESDPFTNKDNWHLLFVVEVLSY
jgi:hypothetical protein